jgi:hypothetical protein
MRKNFHPENLHANLHASRLFHLKPVKHSVRLLITSSNSERDSYNRISNIRNPVTRRVISWPNAFSQAGLFEAIKNLRKFRCLRHKFFCLRGGIVFALRGPMKKIILICFLLIGFTAHSSSGQKSLRTIDNKAFKAGEKLKFRIHYGFIDAGTATMEIKKEIQDVGGRPCFHIVGTGETVGAFDWFFKVRDRYESIVDTQAIIPWLFFRRVSEGGYSVNQNVSFNHYTDSAKSEKKTIAIEKYTQDLLSAFYYSRTFDVKNSKVGDIFPIDGYLDDNTLPLNVKYIGQDVVKTKVGTIKVLGFRPMLQEGRVFKENEDMTVWVSDDDNHIPVRVQAEVLVGSIKMDLISFENIASPLAIVKD